MQYTLLRSARKSCAIHIKDGMVEVRAPYGLSKQRIEAFLAEKRDWIAQNTHLSAQRRAERESFQLDFGATVRYLGRSLTLKRGTGTQAQICGDSVFLPANLTPLQIKAAMIALYKYAAQQILPEKVRTFATQMRVTPGQIHIGSSQTKWGSCSTTTDIRFSWRLAMADEDCVDYVVIHELAHLRQMNHSPRFWAVVESHCPDYKQRSSRLKELSVLLQCEDWTLPKS
jgi:predicted metal-dependent hydrolase